MAQAIELALRYLKLELLEPKESTKEGNKKVQS